MSTVAALTLASRLKPEHVMLLRLGSLRQGTEKGIDAHCMMHMPFEHTDATLHTSCTPSIVRLLFRQPLHSDALDGGHKVQTALTHEQTCLLLFFNARDTALCGEVEHIALDRLLMHSRN